MLSPEFLIGLRDRRVRDRRGLLFIEGVRFVLAAVKAKAQIVGLVFVPTVLRQAAVRNLVKALTASGVPYRRVSAYEFRDLSLAKEPQGIAAVVRQRWSPLVRLDRPAWLAFERVRSPGNLGTSLRTAAATGADGAILLGDSTDPYAPGAVRASMGAIFEQRLVRTGYRHLRAWKRRTRTCVVGTASDARIDYRALSYRRPVVLMMGCEREGLSPAQRAVCDRIVSIPMVGDVDSLNLATASAVLLYEVFNQRTPRTRRH